MESTVVNALERLGSSVQPGWRDRVLCDPVCDGAVHLLADSEGSFLVAAGIRGTQYPDRVAIAMLRELCDKVRSSQSPELLDGVRPGDLSKSMRKQLRDLMQSYDNPGKHDKTVEVRQQVDHLKDIMQDNVKRILETEASLESLEERSQTMSVSANRFLKQSTDLRR